MNESLKTKKINLFTILQTISMLGIFVSVGLVVLLFTGMISFSVGVFALIAIVAIICASSASCLPWAKRLHRHEHKVMSIIYLCCTAVCTVLWIAAVIVVCIIFKRLADNQQLNVANFIAGFKYIQATLVITIQFIIANFVAFAITKYKTRLITFQAITYISSLIVDIYLSALICCVVLTTDGVALGGAIPFLFNKVTLSIFILAAVYTLISYCIICGVRRRKLHFRNRRSVTFLDDALEDIEDEIQSTTISSQPDNSEDATQKLKKLQELLNQNLITQDEYDKKREEIISKI